MSTPAHRIALHAALWLALAALPAAAVGRPTAPTGLELFVDSGQALGGDGLGSGVALGDVDGDGDIDAAVAVFDGPALVYLNQGGAQGGTPGAFAGSGQALGTSAGIDVALGDLDGDKDLDLFIVRDAADDSYEVWINQGGDQGGNAGTFLGSGQVFGSSLSSSVALGDVDGDTDLDAFIARNVGRANHVWLNDGSGQYADSGQALGNDSSIDATLADLDGDGDLDAFVVGSGFDGNTVWINQGGDQAGTSGVFLDSGQVLGDTLSLGVDLADLDGDGDTDAFVATALSDQVWINQGGAQGGTPGQFSSNGQALGGSGSRDVALADLDGDGDRDAFVAVGGANLIWINQGGLQGGSAGQFADSGQSLGQSQHEAVALADLDGDGDADAFVASWEAPDRVYLNRTIEADPPVNPLGWQAQLVDTRAIAGKGVSLVLDAAGRPHIAYFVYQPTESGRDYTIYYARWNGVRWLREGVEAVTWASQQSIGLALTAAGQPRLVYPAVLPEDDGGIALRYAAWDGQTWQLSTVAGETDGEFVSLALDDGDTPHVGFAESGDLYYAIWLAETWVVEAVDAGSDTVGDYISLALDATGVPHIAYEDFSNGALRYAWRAGPGWQSEQVDVGFSGAGSSLAIDSNGEPHISYIHDFGFKIRHAHKDDGAWQIQQPYQAPPSEFINGTTSLGLDGAGRPHIAFTVERNINGVNALLYARWDGAQWVVETLDRSGDVGEHNSLAVDAAGNAHIAYDDATFGDARYVAWAPRWRITPVETGSTARGAAVALYDDLPALSAYRDADGRVRGAIWEDDAWGIEPLAFSGAVVEETSIAYANGRPYASYYDADGGRLMFAAWNGSAWQTTVIDDAGDVGRYHKLLFVGGPALARIAYWDATNRRVKLARFDAIAPAPSISTHSGGPALNGASGRLDAIVLPGGDIGISYYDAANGNLRLATWHAASDTWSDELIDGALSDAGSAHGLALDAGEGRPVAAYYDATNAALKLAVRDGGWQIDIARLGVGLVSDLALDLGMDSLAKPRIAYADATGETVHLLYKEEGIWLLDTMVETAVTGLDQALGRRPHLAYGAASGLHYAARAGTLDVNTTVFTPPVYGDYYNPLDACAAVLDLFLGGEDDEEGSVPARPLAPAQAAAPLGDQAIFAALGNLFSLSPGGKYYVDLYAQHGAEMGRIGVADPALLWDAFGALQNFMPGLEALVQGRGHEVLVTQRMVDDALDVWQRLAAAASPLLAAVINAELAATNNLQDFVGQSFEGWAADIGATPRWAYLPTIFR